MYAQVIVEKRLLTDIDADTDLKIMARVLAHDAKPDSGYAALQPVESFEQ